MGGKGLKLLLLLIALIVYVEAAPGVVEQPNQPPKNDTPAEKKDDLERVNLIFPRVESIDKVQCDDEMAKKEQFVNCTIDFRTRLVKYRILNYDFMSHTGELTKVETMHKNPSLEKSFVYIGGEEFTFPIMEKKATEWLGTENNGPLWKREDMPDFLVCDAYSKFTSKQVEYEFCIHDTTINIRNTKTKELIASAPALDLADLHDYIAPVTSAYVYGGTTSSTEGSKLTFHLFWTDAVGRMKISKVNAAKYKIEAETEPSKPKNYLELSIIPNPITKDFALTWPKESNFLSKKPKLVDRFKADLEMKWRSDFIMAASPIYLSFSIKNTTNQSTTLEPKLDSMGLCFVRGYRMFETTENGLITNFDCRQNGVSQNKFVELPELQSPFLLVTHAYHVANVDGYRYIHLFFTLKHHDQNQNRYAFCKQKGEYSPGTAISSETLINLVTASSTANPTSDEAPYCKVFGDTEKNKLHVSPSDIIAYYDGKVVKTITLWGLMYTVSNYDKPIEVGIRDTAPRPKVIEGIPFRINAAFSTGKTVYFFTYNNLIVIASMNMDTDYQKLTVDFANAQEIFAEKFIFNNFLRAKGETRTLEQPYVTGYYEYQEGADDTEPSSGSNLGGGNETDPDTKPDGKPETKKSSTIWLIVLIIIIAALILAALAYLFFIRGGDEQVVVEPKSAQKSARKSVRKSPQPGLDLESNIKTVRSQHHSTIGAGKSSVNMTKSPSQKSTIKSPGKKSAIARSPSQKSSTKSPGQKSDVKSPSKKSTVKSPLKSIIRSPAQASGTKSGKKSKRKPEKSPASKSIRKSQKSPAKSPTGKTIEKTVTKKN